MTCNSVLQAIYHIVDQLRSIHQNDNDAIHLLYLFNDQNAVRLIFFVEQSLQEERSDPPFSEWILITIAISSNMNGALAALFFNNHSVQL